MRPISRRQLLRGAAGAATLAAFPGLAPSARSGPDRARPELRLATFACDVTPPVGHPLCGGWIEPARAVDDPLQALGVVLLGIGQPVVLCAVDWCGLRNEAHTAWRRALAEAVQTLSERVTVHCVHQHNAPFADLEAEHLLAAVPGAPSSLDVRFFEQAVRRTAGAARASLARAEPFSHIGTGQARVEQVASNRRILGPDGKVQLIRYSASRDPRVRAAPVGLIDPWLKTLSFWNGSRPLAALHYYATHPMSYYGDGRVSSDFPGLARRKRQEEDPQVFQVYFTGCAGNVTAGKYNDGAHENRPVLRDRLHAAMKTAWEATRRQAVSEWEWRVELVKLPARVEPSFGEKESRRVLEDPLQSKARRVNVRLRGRLRRWRPRLPPDRPGLRRGGLRAHGRPGRAGQRTNPAPGRGQAAQSAREGVGRNLPHQALAGNAGRMDHAPLAVGLSGPCLLPALVPGGTLLSGGPSGRSPAERSS